MGFCAGVFRAIFWTRGHRVREGGTQAALGRTQRQSLTERRRVSLTRVQGQGSYEARARRRWSRPSSSWLTRGGCGLLWRPPPPPYATSARAHRANATSACARTGQTVRAPPFWCTPHALQGLGPPNVMAPLARTPPLVSETPTSATVCFLLRAGTLSHGPVNIAP